MVKILLWKWVILRINDFICVVRSYSTLNDRFWFVLLITYRKRLHNVMKIIFSWLNNTMKNSGSRKGEPKGNQRGTFSNLLSSNRFIEIHRSKFVILVPPRGNFKSVTHQRIYGKVPEVPLFLNSYIENFFTLSQKK